MRARTVVIRAPDTQHRSGVGQRREQCLIEKLIPPVEALDDGILRRVFRERCNAIRRGADRPK